MAVSDIFFRTPLWLVMIFGVGVIGAFGIQLIRPIVATTPAPPPELGWAVNPAGELMGWFTVGILLILAVITLWYVFAPIRTDRRQQFR